MALRVVSWIEPIGQLWVNAIRMTVVPLVVSLLFVSIARRDASHRLGRLGVVTLGTFFALLLFAAVVSLLLAPPLMADMKLAPEAAAALRSTATASASGTASQVTQLPGFASWLTGLVPPNIVKAAADGAMLPLILFTLLFALAAREIETALRTALVDFFASIAGAMTMIVGWIITVAPIGIFALVVAAASRVGIALAGAMAYYIVAISAVLMLFALLIYPVATLRGRHPAADLRARVAAGAGRGAQLELVARVAAGAGRGVGTPRHAAADLRIRASAVGVDLQGGDADHLARWDDLSREAVRRPAQRRRARDDRLHGGRAQPDDPRRSAGRRSSCWRPCW